MHVLLISKNHGHVVVKEFFCLLERLSKLAVVISLLAWDSIMLCLEIQLWKLPRKI